MNILYLAALIGVIIGLKYLSPLLIYLILSIFFTILLAPIFKFFDKKGLPTVIAYIATMGGFILIFGVISYIVTISANEFINSFGIYQAKFKDLIVQLNEFLSKYNYKIDSSFIANLDFVGVFKGFLGKAGSLLSGFLIVAIGVSFLLFESKDFVNKIDDLKLDGIDFDYFAKSVQKYFFIKSFTSLLTGILIAFALIIFKMPFIFFFGFLAFILNFIPVVGSIIAAFPALIIAITTFDITTTIYLATIYVAINITVSNVIEPKIMGDGLDLSPAIIFFSLIFWGWIFGVVGTFFAVVLTIILKLALQSSNKTKKYAYLLSKYKSR